ncbi:PhoH family protein [Bacillaceae bacterium SIJ1]|uniref:PhoH family protein n=1 Tax=Litoribacterium kuwaitense TaxID=1398745 RepID=UPI0013EAB497|nr:PhoH family protein [Litoribacterium kuwaitense]NGP44384.1 PhoH family protein [Litoribacterium kuwaitense]
MDTIYVLDTNILLQDPYALFAFQGNEVVVPAIVLEETDAKKKLPDEIGMHARMVARLMDDLRKKGKLYERVALKHGGSIRVELNHRSLKILEQTFVEHTNDNRIIAVALNLRLEEKDKVDGKRVVLVSKDAMVRVKADVVGVEAEDFLNDRVVEPNDSYQGISQHYVDSEVIQSLYKHGKLNAKEDMPLHPNECVLLKSLQEPSVSALGIADGQGTAISPIKVDKEPVWGIRPRNVHQQMACELLMREDIRLVTLVGPAGTGKTLLALAAGLQQTEEKQYYKKMLVARPIVPVGKDIGYLPGEREEKLKPWMQPIFDNLEHLFSVKKREELDRILAGMGAIEVEALSYIRGRSLPDQFVIIDEAQNLTRHEVKTILTRIGEGSKIILMGDTEQIDHPYLDPYNNGLAHVVEKFKNEEISGHIHLVKGERSKLAGISAKLL